MKVFILTYHQNRHEAERLQKQLIEHNFPEPIIVCCLNNCVIEGIPPSKIVYHSFYNFILPFMDDDTIFFEDDAVVKSDYSLYLEHFEKGLVSRLSWYKDQYIFIGGATCVGFKKDIIESLRAYMNKTKPLHFDRFLCRFAREKLTEDDYYIIPKHLRLGSTTSHFSLINGGTDRLGYSSEN